MDARSLQFTPLRYAVIGALMVLTLGFGVMNAFWFIGSWDADVLGLYDFKSATLGDGLVLPTLAFLLIRTGRWHQRWSRRDNAVVAVCGVVAGAAGIVMQFSWLDDPGTVLNWTIPSPGVFNVAGYYHAFFLVLAMAVFAALTCRSLIALRRVDQPVPAKWRLELAALLICAPLFPALWSLDFVSSSDGPSALLSAIAWTWVLPPLCIAAVRAHRWRPYLLATFVAEATVVAVSAVVVLAPPLDTRSTLWWLAIAFFAPNFAVAMWRTSSRAMATLGCLGMFASGVAVGLLGSEAAESAPQWFALTTSGILLAWATVLLAASVDTRANLLARKHVAVESVINSAVLVGVILFGLFVSSRADNAFADGIFLVWSLMVVGGITFEKMLFQEQVRAEDCSDSAGHQTERIRVFQWGLLSLAAVLVILVLNEMTLSTSVSRERLSVVLNANAVTAFIVVHIAALILMTGTVGARNLTTVRFRRAVVLGTAASMFVAATVLIRETWSALIGAERQALILTGMTIPILGLLGFTVLSLTGNVYRLRGKRVPSSYRFIAFAVGILVAMTTWGCLSLVLMSSGLPQLLAGGILVGVVMLPLAVVHTTTSEDLSMYLVKASPRQGLFQDASLATLLCAVVVGYPTYNLLAHDELESILVRSVAVLGLVAGLYGWMLANNVEHAAKYRPTRDQESLPAEVHTGPGPRAQDSVVGPSSGPGALSKAQLYQRIRSHTRWQNAISALMLLPVVPYLLSILNIEEVGLALLATDPGDSDSA